MKKIVLLLLLILVGSSSQNEIDRKDHKNQDSFQLSDQMNDTDEKHELEETKVKEKK